MSTARERQKGERSVNSVLIPNETFLTEEQEKAKKFSSYFPTINESKEIVI